MLLFSSISSLHFLPILSCVCLVCIVRMLVCAGACVCVRVYAFRIVSRDNCPDMTIPVDWA